MHDSTLPMKLKNIDVISFRYSTVLYIQDAAQQLYETDNVEVVRFGCTVQHGRQEIE